MKKIIGISFFFLVLLFISCQNDTVDVSYDEVLTEKAAQITLTEVSLEAVATASEYEVEFYANAEEMLTRWWRIGKRWGWTKKLRYAANQCPDVTVVEGENDGYPKTITLDYGEGTVLKNEKVLSGIIVIEISGPMKNTGFTRLVTYDKFAVDTVQIAGTSLITVNRENATFRNYTSDLTFTINNETIITRSSNRTWTWIEGMETTEDQTDDVIHIEGIVEAEMDAETYKKEIVEPLVRLGDCRFIVSGIVRITINDELISSLNYGEGECDDIATMINSDGETVEVDLSKCKMKGKNKGKQENR